VQAPHPDERKLIFSGELADTRERFLPLLTELAAGPWVVYAKPPFGGPRQVIDYLGRYTHRVAISNQRLRNIEGDQVTFDYLHYRSKDRFKKRRMSLGADEFIRRFLLHTLPAGFQRIRHYGLLASRSKQYTLSLCRRLLQVATDLLPSTAQIVTSLRELLDAAHRCPRCRIGTLIRIEALPAIPYGYPFAPTWDSS